VNNIFSLKDKVVCVIGGTGLIGKEISKGFIDAGAIVYIGTRKVLKNERNLYYKKIDISKEKCIDAFLASVYEENKSIDVLVNCSFPQNAYSSIELDAIKTKEMVIDIEHHLLGYFNVCRKIFKIMRKQKQGSIINFGSIYGEFSPNFDMYKNTEIKKIPTYFLIKGGIHMMTKYFASIGGEYNIRVNTIAPGGVYDKHSEQFVSNYSAHVPMKKMAQPVDCVGATVFFASDASEYITGQTLFVDGGFSIV